MNGERTENERSPNGERTEDQRRMNGERTENERSPNGERTEDNTENTQQLMLKKNAKRVLMKKLMGINGT